MLSDQSTTKRTGLSEREYAARVGLSRGAINKARSAGRLVLNDDGSIDPVGSDAKMADLTNPAMRRTKRRTSVRPVPDAAVGVVSETLREHGMMPPASPTGMTFMQARTANEVLKAQERRLRLQTLKGELVDRARAVSLVFRLARQERDAWTTWPTRVAALMAAELGVNAHQMQEVLSRHVDGQLEALAEISADFR